MAKYQNLSAVLNKIKTNTQQSSFLEDIANTNQIDTQETLELLNVTNDVTIQAKLFSALSACLLLNKDANFDVIIMYSAVYDKINNVLIKGLPRKAVHALNFVLALLSVDAEDDGPTRRRTLALYAKNMIRSSGCLGSLADMFANCMMYHDTWNALCQCLAAACGGSDLNQSYCTHLIPVCIQRCNQTNLEIFLVLKSLLQNHKRNLELFMNSNGISLFSRELLHNDKCLQLLMTVVENPTAINVLLRQVQVLNDLRDFLRVYGPNSQIGQKAKVILNHIELRSRGLDLPDNERSINIISNRKKSKEDVDTNAGMYANQENDKLDDTATLMQKVLQEVFKYKQNEQASKEASKANMNSLIRSTSIMAIDSKGQRYIRQNLSPRQQQNSGQHINSRPNKNSIQHMTSRQHINSRKHMNSGRNINLTQHKNSHTLNIMNKSIEKHLRDNSDYYNKPEQSFSFLQNCTIDHYRNRKHEQTTDTSKIFKVPRGKTDKKVVEPHHFGNNKNESSYINRTKSNVTATFIDHEDFKPKFSSTPKLRERSKLWDFSGPSACKSSFAHQSQTTLQRSRKVVKPKSSMPKISLQNKDKKLRNTSLSTRLLSAINESCVTLVKTVASVFKKKDALISKDRSETDISQGEEDPTCSLSFLGYMQKRDAVMANLSKIKNKDCAEFSVGTESCDTCDTLTLKTKITKNERLKQTVKKLKMGINLYGCDFKKISRTMWPRESYMTPLVLYNLYRRLLLK